MCNTVPRHQQAPRPPAGDHPRPHTTCTLPQRGSKHLRPAPYRTTQPADTPTRKPTPIPHLRPHPHNQTPCPDHATGSRLVRPGRRRPSRQGGPARPPRGTFCAQGNRLRRKRPGFVTFCAKRHPVHKMSRPAQNVPPHHPHPRDQEPRPRNRPCPVRAKRARTVPGCSLTSTSLSLSFLECGVLMHLAVRGAP